MDPIRKRWLAFYRIYRNLRTYGVWGAEAMGQIRCSWRELHAGTDLDEWFDRMWKMDLAVDPLKFSLLHRIIMMRKRKEARGD